MTRKQENTIARTAADIIGKARTQKIIDETMADCYRAGLNRNEAIRAAALVLEGVIEADNNTIIDSL
jgi:hypothetical protein